MVSLIRPVASGRGVLGWLLSAATVAAAPAVAQRSALHEVRDIGSFGGSVCLGLFGSGDPRGAAFFYSGT